MNVPVWFSIGAAAFLAVLTGLWVRWFSRLWRRMRDHPERMGEDWDPFA